MELTRRKNSPFHRIGNSYGSLFDKDHFLGRSAFEDSWVAPPPKANVYEGGKGYEIELAMPGLAKDEIIMSAQNGLLTIDIDCPRQANKTYLSKEIEILRRKQIFQLPKDADQERIVAQLNAGILKIILPYTKDAMHISHHIKVA